MANMTDNDVMINIRAMLDRKVSLLTADCCIYEVPYDIRILNKDAYTPKVVSIGPMHFGNPRLQNMESHKQIYFQRFIRRSDETNMVDNLVNKVKELEPRVRGCYSEKIKLSDMELVQVILVDAIFILELFLTTNRSYNKWEEHDKILLKPWLKDNIMLDLILLENQLPFFVLEELYNLAFSAHQSIEFPPLLKLTVKYFDDYNMSELRSTDITPIKHFTDMLRTFYLQKSATRPPRNEDIVGHLYSATELLEAGVKFDVNDGSNCLLDLELSGRHLKIPELKVDDSAETMFRNIVALEQCHYPSESYMIDYLDFFDYLINTGEDVDVLVRNGIILNWLGDRNAVANLFNGLLKNVTQMNFNSGYHKICTDLNDIYDNRINKLKAALRRDYGKTPWQAAASFAAIILLILTITQTVFSILQVVLQNG